VLIGAFRADGKMNASGLGFAVAVRHHSMSVSIEMGSQTLASLPSVFAAVDAEAVLVLVVPAQREHLAGPQSEYP